MRARYPCSLCFSTAVQERCSPRQKSRVGTSQSKSATSVNLSNSGYLAMCCQASWTKWKSEKVSTPLRNTCCGFQKSTDDFPKVNSQPATPVAGVGARGEGWTSRRVSGFGFRVQGLGFRVQWFTSPSIASNTRESLRTPHISPCFSSCFLREFRALFPLPSKERTT